MVEDSLENYFFNQVTLIDKFIIDTCTESRILSNSEADNKSLIGKSFMRGLKSFTVASACNNKSSLCNINFILSYDKLEPA